MHSACQEDHLLLHVGFIYIVRNGEYVADIFVYGVAKFLYSETILQCRCVISLLLYAVDIVLQVLVSVGREVAEEDRVVVMLESVAEGQRVQVGALRLLILVHITGDVVFIVFIVRLYVEG